MYKSPLFSTSFPAYIVLFIETILTVWDDVLLWFWFVYFCLMMLSIFLCTFCVSSLENCLFWSFTHFLIKLFYFFVLLSSGMCLDINPLSNIWFANVFSQSIHCSFYWLFSLLCRAFYLNVVLFWPKRSLFWFFHDTEKPKWTLCQANAFFLYFFFFFWPVHCQDQYQGAYSLCNLLGFLWF